MRLKIFAGCLLLTMICAFESCTPSDPKFKQYMVEGEQLYRSNCSNCHQADGKGLRKVYPPLSPSDFVDTHFNQVICGMKYGMQGEIVVNGITYHQAMPGVPSLTELEMAEIATYVYNSWGRQRGLVEAKEVSRLLDSCSVVRPYR
jgi:cytochrome c551